MTVRFEDTPEDEKVAFIEGEVNTSNAKELEKLLDENVSMTDDFIMDFEKVPYISSAGLRILLKMQKELTKIGSFKLRNVNENVLEILKTVRLDKVISIEGMATKENETYENLPEIKIDEYELQEEEKELLPMRVRYLCQEEKLKAYSASYNGDYAGFMVYTLAESNNTATIYYIYIVEDARGKDVAKTLVKKASKILEDQGVEEICVNILAETDGEDFAAKLGFDKVKKVNHILKYNKKQILESSMWKQIDKLREMFDKVKIYDELDYLQKLEIDSLVSDDDFDEIDRLYTRFFVLDDTVTSFLNAQEITDNNIWINKLKVLSEKNVNYAPVLLLSSVIDAVATLLSDEDNIQLVDSNANMLNSYKQVLGEPLETLKDKLYIKK